METQEELKNRRAEPDLRVINATLGFWWILAGRGSLHSERTLPEHVLFFFSFSFSPMASLKARSLWRGNVLFSWGRYFVCSLEATLPLESSQKNTAARSPLPPSLSFAVPPCPPLLFIPPLCHPSPLLLIISVCFFCCWAHRIARHKQVQRHSQSSLQNNLLLQHAAGLRAEIYSVTTSKCCQKLQFMSYLIPQST